MQYATDLRDNPRKGGPTIRKPAVVGAVIELGYCLNLLDAEFLDLLRDAYHDLKALHDAVAVELPKNKVIGSDILLRRLDCAVINALHRTRVEKKLRPFDTVRAAFAEGGPLCANSGITAKHHIQLCVRRRSCIKGYFRPMSESALPED